MKSLELPTLAGLADYIRAGAWRYADRPARYVAMRMVSERIIALREAAGLDPFNDALLGDPAGVEQQVLFAFLADHTQEREI